MIFSIQHSSRQDSRIPLLLVYVSPKHCMEPTNHPNGARFCMWYYCVEGRGEFSLNGKRVLLRPGQCMMLLPDTPYSCKALPGGCTIHLLGFTGSRCVELLQTCGMGEAGVYQILDGNILPTAAERLLELRRQNAGQREFSKLCYGLLVDLSSRIERLPEIQPDSPVNETVQRIIDYLETHYREPISLDMLVNEVHLTKEYLCVLFKREMGHTILNYLTLIRIGWARLYLEQYPEKRSYEIGRMCGFESPSYFGKKFREIVGMTPESYRRVNSISV